MTKQKEDERILRIALTGLAEGIIDNYRHLEIKHATIIKKKNGWKSIKFDYKDTS